MKYFTTILNNGGLTWLTMLLVH